MPVDLASTADPIETTDRRAMLERYALLGGLEEFLLGLAFFDTDVEVWPLELMRDKRIGERLEEELKEEGAYLAAVLQLQGELWPNEDDELFTSAESYTASGESHLVAAQLCSALVEAEARCGFLSMMARRHVAEAQKEFASARAAAKNGLDRTGETSDAS